MRKLLVVVDMQNDFITGSLGTKEAQAIVPKVIEKIKNHTDAIYVTQDTHRSDYLYTQEGRNLPVEHCIIETDGWKIEESVHDAIIDYHGVVNGYYNAYKNTFGSEGFAEDLSDFVKIHNLEEIVFIGLCTDICVISNALLAKAFAPEVKITVDASCCAGVTPESHENALRAMKMCQINIENWEG